MNYSLHPDALGDFRDVAPFYREQAVKLMGGLVLIVLGAGLFVLFTSSINVAQSMGSAMAMGSPLQWRSVILGSRPRFPEPRSWWGKTRAVRLERLWVDIIVAGIGVLFLGIWNQIDGPPLTTIQTRSDERRFPVPPALNGVVCVWASVTMLGGLLLVVLTTRPVGN